MRHLSGVGPGEETLGVRSGAGPEFPGYELFAGVIQSLLPKLATEACYRCWSERGS